MMSSLCGNIQPARVTDEWRRAARAKASPNLKARFRRLEWWRGNAPYRDGLKLVGIVIRRQMRPGRGRRSSHRKKTARLG